jgi:aminopeptidase N
MKRGIKKSLLLNLYFFVSFAFHLNAQQTASIKKLPPEKYPRKANVDIKHIALDLQFNWEKKQAYGNAVINFTPVKNIDSFKLDAAFLSIHSVKLANGNSLKFNYNGGEGFENLIIYLNRTYTLKEKVTVVINYNTNWINHSDPNAIWGSFGKGLRFLQPTSTTPIKRKQIWSSGEPTSNRYWFPGIEEPGDLRTTELKATVANNFTVISNGDLISTKENSDGTKTFHYKAGIPYPNFLTSIVVGEYANVKQQFKNIPLNTFAYPDEEEAAKATVVRLPDMIKYFSEITGVNYPYPHYTQVMVQDYPFPGLTGQHTATIISDNMIDSYTTHADFFYLWDGVEAASLASQWFGNLLSIKNWSDMWLNTGFSHYLDGLFTQYALDKDEYLTYYLPYDLNAVTIGDWASGNRLPVVTKNYEDAAAFTNSNYPRFRGALVLRMLQNEIGDELFFKCFKKYVRKNAFKQVSTTDFQKAVEETTGRSYQWFFDQWVYKIGLPKFLVTKKYDAVKKQLILTLTQTQQYDSTPVYPQVKYFTGKMKMEIDGKIETVQLKAEKINNFHFNLPTEPKLVNADFESVWIKEMEFKKTPEELLYQLKNDKDVTGKWWAIDELMKIYSGDTIGVVTKETIKQALQNIASGNDYWRLRNYALGRLNKIFSTDNKSTPYQLSETTGAMLLQLANDKQAWIRTTAITILGMTKDEKYTSLYINCLNDSSERVINAAAVALGKTKSNKAFDALAQLQYKPTWKSQHIISWLNGLKELGDPRGADIALKYLSNNTMPRWWLATSTWDYPVTAAETLVAFGKAGLGYPVILDRLKISLQEDDYNDIFANVFLIVTLADERAKEIFPLLKEKFKNDANAMVAVNNYEQQFNDLLKK